MNAVLFKKLEAIKLCLESVRGEMTEPDLEFIAHCLDVTILAVDELIVGDSVEVTSCSLH